ncbi:F-box only protein 39-like [Engraulis encrasicolus]|uniref:F-box only protein 39-like n=1 Tax=Engraulis encrasicolus TaxID=184585 RepID=UPI002FD15627
MEGPEIAENILPTYAGYDKDRPQDGREVENGKINEENMEEDREGEQSMWALLPHTCLLQVFLHLNDRDRVRAALVCRHWHHVVRSPSLWRVRTFNFSGRVSRSHRSEMETAVSFATSYGRYLEDLEIRFSHPINSLVTRRFQQATRAFLSALRKTHSRLQALTIKHLDLDRSSWCRSVRCGLLRSLTYYLRKEGSWMNYMNLRGARFNLQQGLEVLEALSTAQRHKHIGRRLGLATLNLEDYFSQSIPVYNNADFPQIMQRFRGLTTLTMNYSCVSEQLLDALATGCRGLDNSGQPMLRSLTIRCHIHEPHGQMIWGNAWANLARRCPELRVHMYVERILNLDSLSRILLREIPIKTLSLSSCYFSEQDWSAKPALSQLAPFYHQHLQRLSLDLNNCHEQVDEELLELILSCKKLVYLKVWAFLSINFLERLLQSRMERKINVKTIKVRIYTNTFETQEEDEMLEGLHLRYRPLIDSELNYFACSYPML